MPQHNMDIDWSRGTNSTDLVRQRITTTAQSETIIGDTSSPVTVPDDTTDFEVACAIDVSTLKSLFILSDQDLTLETNDGTTADDSIDLVAGVPLIWEAASGYYACPLTADVTALFLSNAGATDANFQMRVLQDPTP